jgi:superfamily II DNA/RNA helicase
VLRALLREATDLKNAIIFCNRKREVALLAKSLQKHGFSVGALHGDMEQSARTAALDQFRKGELPILVASDVAARGLDIPEVSHVYNFDVPHHSDDYVHRIGRTGRAGRTGTAISLVCPSDQKSMLAIEKLIGQSISKTETSLAISEPVEGETASTEAPRQSRNRTGNREANAEHPRGGRDGHRNDQPREGGRDRKPRRERGPRREGSDRTHSPQPQAAEAVFVAPTTVSHEVSRPPSIGRTEAPRQRRDDNEPADHSHLPAFLLRPIRARV